MLKIIENASEMISLPLSEEKGLIEDIGLNY
jgi:hypothetical protein